MRIYKETQEELTSELADFKEKYREIVDLLHDTQNELKAAKKRSYPGVGEHKVSGMFESNTTKESKDKGKLKICPGVLNLRQIEIQGDLKSTWKCNVIILEAFKDAFAVDGLGRNSNLSIFC